MKTAIPFLIAFALPVAFAASLGFLSTPEREPEVDVREEPLDAQTSMVIEWLESQRSGESGQRFWSQQQKTISRLYSVSSWEIVKKPNGSSRTSANVIVESSTKLGIPIRKTWAIHIERELVDGRLVPRITEISDLSG